jgi:hypothetical protein
MQKARRALAFAASTLPLAMWLVGACRAAGSVPTPALEPVPIPKQPTTPVLKVVPARTPFSVELSTELSSRTNRPGEPFRARVLTPLQDEDGDTIVPTDAELVGRVMAIGQPPDPTIFIRFDAIETLWGPREVRATFTRSQPSPSVMGDLPQFPGYDGALQRAGGIPLFSEDAPSNAGFIDLPAGARLRMVLTDPLAIRALEPSGPPPVPQ